MGWNRKGQTLSFNIEILEVGQGVLIFHLGKPSNAQYIFCNPISALPSRLDDLHLPPYPPSLQHKIP